MSKFSNVFFSFIKLIYINNHYSQVVRKERFQKMNMIIRTLFYKFLTVEAFVEDSHILI